MIFIKIAFVKTTIPFHRQLMNDERYVAGDYTTAFMDTFKMKEQR